MNRMHNLIRISPYFYLKEFQCHGQKQNDNCFCNNAAIIDSNFFDRLVIFRRHIDRPILIERCYSCPAWNKYIGGHEKSKHLSGMAIDWDVYSSGFTEKEAAQIALDTKLFTGIGIYGKSYRDHNTGDIVLIRGYKNIRGMIHLEYCQDEDNIPDAPGETILYRKWGDWAND